MDPESLEQKDTDSWNIVEVRHFPAWHRFPYNVDDEKDTAVSIGKLTHVYYLFMGPLFSLCFRACLKL